MFAQISVRYTYGYNNPIRYYDPIGHIVTEWDKRNCTKEQIRTIEKATKDYDAAKARGDQKGMNAAHAMAVNAGAASGVAASLSMGLSDIFVINDDNKNETVYLVGRLTGAVVVATVAIVMTVRSGASAVSTAPTVVGTAVSVASVVDNGGKAISAIGVAGDTIDTLIANSKEKSSVGSIDDKNFGGVGMIIKRSQWMVKNMQSLENAYILAMR